MSGHALTEHDKWEIALRHRDSMKLQNQIGFSDMECRTPDIDFYQDGECYTNGDMIHMGAFISMFGDVEDETELVSQWDYIRGHEEQHCRSTADRPYALGIQRGCFAILDHIAIQSKAKVRLTKDSDYEYFANSVLPKMGIHINYRMMQQIVGGIMNSLEDGRIERIRSTRFPGFESLRVKYRGMFWENDNEQYKPYSDVEKNSGLRLQLLCNQILMLATCQLYQKGFSQAYAGTPLMDEIAGFMPEIGKAVMAGKTREMADQGVRICSKLAPYIYEACKMSDKDIAAKKALEKLLADMIKGMVDAMPDTGLSEQDEDTDEGSAASTFPISDLVITLDDETYDKLVKNSKKSDSGDGLMIRREHPKEDEQEKSGNPQKEDGQRAGEQKNGDSDSGSGQNGQSGGAGSENGQNDSSDSSDGQTENGSNQGSSSRENSSDKEQGGERQNSCSSASEEPSEKNGDTSEKQGSSGSGSEEGNSNEENNSAGGQNLQSSSDNSKMNPGSNSSSQKASKKSAEKLADSKEAVASAEESVKRAMQEAAEKADAASEEKIESVNKINAAQNKASKRGTSKESPDNTEPIKPEMMKDICNFSEVKRKYKITDNLPPVLARRGTALHKKNEKYFKGLSTPNISYLDSGSIDPSRIFGLSFGDTEVFRKNGKDKRFDGCAYILIDNSGSMAGDKRREACKAAAVIEEGFKGLVPIKIVAFDTYGTVIHEIVKNWNESYQKNCCWNFCLHGRSGGGNEDNFDIQIATRELLARPESKKLMVVLSDGTPGNTRATKGAIEAARRKGIQVSGIYFEEGCIGSDANDFRDMYQKDYVCCEASQIDQNLQKIFQKFSRS